MSDTVYIDFVGQFWRPHRVSFRKVEKVLAWTRPKIAGKPRVRLISYPEYGQFLAVWSNQCPN